MLPVSRHKHEVFPAHAGMIPQIIKWYEAGISVPRACGDDPEGMKRKLYDVPCSPRMRG